MVHSPSHRLSVKGVCLLAKERERERETHKGSLRSDRVLPYTTDGELSDRSRVYRKSSLVPYLRAIEIHWRKISLTQLVTL